MAPRQRKVRTIKAQTGDGGSLATWHGRTAARGRSPEQCQRGETEHYFGFSSAISDSPIRMSSMVGSSKSVRSRTCFAVTPVSSSKWCMFFSASAAFSSLALRALGIHPLRLGGSFEARSEVHRVPDGGELLADRRADVSNHCIAGVQANPEGQWAVTAGGTGAVENHQPLAHRDGAGNRARGMIRLGQRGTEVGHQPIADELVECASVFEERLHHRPVVLVEQGSNRGGLHGLGEAGEVAQVAEEHSDPPARRRGPWTVQVRDLPCDRRREVAIQALVPHAFPHCPFDDRSEPSWKKAQNRAVEEQHERRCERVGGQRKPGVMEHRTFQQDPHRAPWSRRQPNRGHQCRRS